MIYDFSGTLQVTSGTYSTVASASGADLIVSVGNGSILIKDVATADLKIHGTYSDNGNTLPAGISVKGSTLTASTITKVNASALSCGISNISTAAANSLKGGKGTDTIFGSDGNDTVSFGGGNDIYVYQSGNDLIQDYTVGADKIKLASASITGASLSGTNVVLKLPSVT